MGIVISTHLPPPVMIESTEVRRLVTHMLCWSWAMYFSAAASSENDHGSMNLASNTAPLPVHDAVQGCRHPRRPNAGPGAGTSRTCRPVLRSYQWRLSSSVTAELDDEVAGQVLRLGLAPFLPPQADQGCFIAAHDDPGVRAADEKSSFKTIH